MFKIIGLTQSTSTEASAAVQRIALRALTLEERDSFFRLSIKLIKEFNNISQGGVDPHLAKLQGAIELGIVDPGKVKEVKAKIAELKISEISSASISKAGHQVAQLSAVASAIVAAKPALTKEEKKAALKKELADMGYGKETKAGK